jgi:hypothetical protein
MRNKQNVLRSPQSWRPRRLMSLTRSMKDRVSCRIRRHHGTYPDSPRRRRVEGTQHFRRRIGPADRRPVNRVIGIINGQRAITADNGTAARPLVRHQPGILAQSAKAVVALGARRSWRPCGKAFQRNASGRFTSAPGALRERHEGELRGGERGIAAR